MFIRKKPTEVIRINVRFGYQVFRSGYVFIICTNIWFGLVVNFIEKFGIIRFKLGKKI